MPDRVNGNDVVADLTFAVPQDTKPRFESAALTGGLPRVFFETEDRPVSIRDMRRASVNMSLDTTGFELQRHVSGVENLHEDGDGASAYDKETEGLLKELTGADLVVVFDRTRRSDAPQGARNPDGFRGPANRVHVDYTDLSGPQRARDVLGNATVDRVLGGGGRIMQINVWRPMQGPVQRTPLAVADANSVPRKDLIATDQIFPDRVGEIYHLAWSADHCWYWVPEMERDEVLLIKGWDSLEDGRARYTPHGAFKLQKQEGPPRESIELRTFLVFESGKHPTVGA